MRPAARIRNRAIPPRQPTLRRRPEQVSGNARRALYQCLGEGDGTSFTDRRLQAIAQKVGLDMNAFSSCYSSQKYLKQVAQDGQDAKSSGIKGNTLVYPHLYGQWPAADCLN